MRRYLVDPINDHRAGVDMAHSCCGVPCFCGTHIYGRIAYAPASGRTNML